MVRVDLEGFIGWVGGIVFHWGFIQWGKGYIGVEGDFVAV